MNLTLLDGYKWSHVVDEDADDDDDEEDVDVFSTYLHINLLLGKLQSHLSSSFQYSILGVSMHSHACTCACTAR